jgi:hypothetical protein
VHNILKDTYFDNVICRKKCESKHNFYFSIRMSTGWHDVLNFVVIFKLRNVAKIKQGLIIINSFNLT